MLRSHSVLEVPNNNSVWVLWVASVFTLVPSSTMYQVWTVHCLDTRRRISDGPWQPWEDWVQFKSQLSRWRPTEAVRNFSSVDSGFPSLLLVSNTSLIFSSFGIHAVSGMLRYTLPFSVLLVCGCSAFVRELDGRWAWCAKLLKTVGFFWYISLSFLDLIENHF